MKMLTGWRLFPVIGHRAAVSVPSIDNYAARRLANQLVNIGGTKWLDLGQHVDCFSKGPDANALQHPIAAA
jgi:hypothetical protein